MSKKRNIFFIIFSLAVVAALGLSFAFSPSDDQDLDEKKIGQEEIKSYLRDNGLSPNFGGQVFADYYEFEKEGDKIYIWAYISEYYNQDGTLKQGSAVSGPVVLEISEGEIEKLKRSGDGPAYSEDIKKMFPAELHDDVLSFQSKYKQELERLSQSVEEKARQALKLEDFEKKLDTEYISFQDWQIEVFENLEEHPEGSKLSERDSGIACKKDSSTSSLPESWITKTIKNRSYCIRVKSEGAAGSVYKDYKYSTLKEDRLVVVSLTAQYPNCDNLPEPERAECVKEQESFDLDQVVAEVVKER